MGVFDFFKGGKKKKPEGTGTGVTEQATPLSPFAKQALESKKTGSEVPIDESPTPTQKWWESGTGRAAYKSGASLEDFTDPSAPKEGSAGSTLDQTIAEGRRKMKLGVSLENFTTPEQPQEGQKDTRTFSEKFKFDPEQSRQRHPNVPEDEGDKGRRA